MKYNNRYYILRHGQSVSNVKNIHSCWPEKFHFPLTAEGRKEAGAAAKKLKKENIDFIFSSDLLRTKQTAEIVGKELDLKVKYDKRLREVDIGIFNGKPTGPFKKLFPVKVRFKAKPAKGENYTDVEKRILDFLKNIDKEYKGRNILIISHQAPLALLEIKVKAKDFEKFFRDKKLETGQVRKII